MNEQCDRCPARSVHVYVGLLPVTNRDDGGELVLAFCQHHSARYGPALDELGWRIKILEGASA